MRRVVMLALYMVRDWSTFVSWQPFETSTLVFIWLDHASAFARRWQFGRNHCNSEGRSRISAHGLFVRACCKRRRDISGSPAVGQSCIHSLARIRAYGRDQQGHLLYGIKSVSVFASRLQAIVTECSKAARSTDARDKYFLVSH